VSEQPDQWSACHFSLANPEGPGRGDVPRFLRRLADTVQEHGDIEIQDIVFVQEIDDDGDMFPRATVYYHRTEPESGEKADEAGVSQGAAGSNPVSPTVVVTDQGPFPP
jgi:hypothetical protein